MNSDKKYDRPRFASNRTENGLKLAIALPGVVKDEIKVSLEDSILSVNGLRPSLTGDFTNHDDEAKNLELKVELHPDLDPNNIEALHEHGVLNLTFHKRKELTPRKIDILAN